MTQPPIDPAGRQPLGDSGPTEPVPVVTRPAMPPFATSGGSAGTSPFDAPAFTSPAFASPEATLPPPAGPLPPAGAIPPAFGFAPVEPEPAAGVATARVEVARSTPAARGGSSRVLNVALGAAILVGAVGIAFAAGRATAPSAGTSNAAAADDGGARGGFVPGNGAGPGAGNGAGPGADDGGNLPGASFDLNGNGNGDGDRDGGFPGFGFGRGFGGAGLSGKVTAVTADSITIQTDGGQVVTLNLDGTTTYHQQGDASASDVKVGTTVEVQPNGRIDPTRGSNGEINLGTAGSVTIVP